MSVWIFPILLTIGFIVARIIAVYNSKEFKYRCVDREIARYGNAAGWLAYPLLIKLDLQGKPKYEQMIEEGASLTQLRDAIRADVQEFVDEQNKPSNLFHEPTEAEKEYNRLMEERELTPRALVAGYFKIPWSQLKEQEFNLGFYITDTVSDHTWRVPCKHLGQSLEWEDGHVSHLMLGMSEQIYQIHEIDENMQPVGTHMLSELSVSQAIRNNGQYVTELEKPRQRFIIGVPL